MSYDPPRKGCKHGKSFNEPCRACDIIWHQEGLRIAEANVNRHTNALRELGVPPTGRF